LGGGGVFFGEDLGAGKIAGAAVILLGDYLARKQRSGPHAG
jgi:drug/metabolite transporter (DMT)-like permease